MIDVELNLVRKEMAPDDAVLDQTVITSWQCLDGAAFKGDHIPVFLDLASIKDRLTPTMILVNRLFSIRYFLSLVLRDAEGRKYYKQVEIYLIRPTGAEDADTSLSNYKLGLASR